MLGALAVGFGVALMTTAGYLISRAAEQPPILSLTVTIVAVRFFGLARPLARYLERLASHDLALRALGRIRARFYERIEPLAPGQLEGYRRGELLGRMVGDVDALQGLYLRGLGPPLVALAVGAACVGVDGGVPARRGGDPRGRAGPRRRARSGADGRADPGRRPPAGAPRGRSSPPSSSSCCAARRSSSSTAARRTRSRGSGRADGELARLGRRDALAAGLADGLSILVAGLTVAGVLAVAVAANAARSTACSSRRSRCSRSRRSSASRRFGAARSSRPRSRPAGACSSWSTASRRCAIPPSLAPAPALPAVVALEGVTARYAPGRAAALSGFDLRLEPGRRVALVGPSGAGKTTVTNLLLRFLDPEEGRVTLAGRDLREYRQEDVRRTFALAGQDAHVFDSTIRANLASRRPGATDAELEDALAPRAPRRVGRLAPRRARHARRRGGHASSRAASASA